MDLRRSLVFRSSNACSTFKCSQSIQDIYIYIQLVHPSRTFYSRIQKNLSRGCHILPCFSFPSICSPMFSQCSFSKLHGRHSAGHFPHLTGPVNPMAGIPIAKKHYTAVIPPNIHIIIDDHASCTSISQWLVILKLETDNQWSWPHFKKHPSGEGTILIQMENGHVEFATKLQSFLTQAPFRFHIRTDWTIRKAAAAPLLKLQGPRAWRR